MNIEFPDSLPVSALREEIGRAICDHPVVIVCGETGSGKTTQLPKIALSIGRGAKGKTIAHTQPRRIAAVTVARRIAQELNTTCGDEPSSLVGYQVRFNDKSRPGVPVKLMTDGILLAQTQQDPLLSAYDTIIVDEAHERSLNIDFLLGYLKSLLAKRSDLKVIITSATIDAEKFAKHFGVANQPAPVIEVSGRLYPVEVRWRPPLSTDHDLVETVVAGIEECEQDWSGQGPGDILVFLPGEREIRAVADELRSRVGRTSLALAGRQAQEVLPLYARLSQQEQERVFRSSGARRVVLATNVAETSLTVPGIRYVVDSGLARVKRYRFRGKVEQLQIEPIAQAQANQRAGRCGRVAHGVCVRLYDEEDFSKRPPFADPEIHRSSLAAVMLRMKALGLPDIREFPFLEPPSGKAIADGHAMLRELDAIDESGALTPTGRSMARLPVDPRIARMIISARALGALKEILIIASALSVQDPRDRPADQTAAAGQAHAQYADPRSEFISLLKLWDCAQRYYEDRESNRKYEQVLKSQFLSALRVREWREVHQQLCEWVAELDWKPNEIAASYEAIHQAILSGLLSNLGCRAPEEPIWLGTHDVKFLIWPGSYLAKKPPRWLMAAEQVETSRLFARTIAAIEPEWVERVGQHLLKKSYSEPHWEKKSGRVIGYERATLYGLTIYQRRKVSWAQLGSKQATEAREIFIRSALVEGDWETQLHFYAHNAKRIREVQALEHKARRPDILVDDELLFAFYDQSIPQHVVDAQSLADWYLNERRVNPDSLCVSKEDLMRHEASGITTDQFPKLFRAGDLSFALEYQFSPGDVRDGVTMIVPQTALAKLDCPQADWLVPGMLKEKVQALLKSLPQKLRRHCIPLAEYADGFCERSVESSKSMPLIAALIQDISEQTGIAPKRDDFKLEAIAAHCWMNYRVIDEHGRMLAEGRDLSALREALGVEQAGPGSVSAIKLEAEMIDRFAQAVKEPLKALDKEVQSKKEVSLAFAFIGGAEMLSAQLRELVVRRVFVLPTAPQTEEEFAARLAAGKSRVLLVGQEILRGLSAILAEYALIQKKLPSVKAHGLAHADITQQLSRLMPKDFMLATPPERFMHLPRYLKAISVRMEKLRSDASRDARWQSEAHAVEQPFWRWAQARRGPWSDRMLEFRWMLEELRVSLFAQELKTPMPVSVKRLQKSWVELQR